MQEEHSTSIARRKLLRRAGTVAAGVAGAGVVSVVAAAPAQAAPDGPVLMNPANDAGTNVTGITTNDLAQPTLRLANTAVSESSQGPALQLVPGQVLPNGGAIGTIGADQFGGIWTTVGVDGGTTFPVPLYSAATANITVPLRVSQRALDTREAAGRTKVLNPSGNLDSEGRLIGGRTIDLDLTDYAAFAEAVFGTIAVLAPEQGGFVVVWATGEPQPPTANVGWVANQSVNSFLLSAAGIVDDGSAVNTALSIYANVTTHLIFDVWGFLVAFRGQVSPTISARSAPAASSARDATRAQAIQKFLTQRS